MTFRSTPFMREIVAVLALKAVAVAVIWAAFFGPAQRPLVDRHALAQHLELPHAQRTPAQRASGGAR